MNVTVTCIIFILYKKSENKTLNSNKQTTKTQTSMNTNYTNIQKAETRKIIWTGKNQSRINICYTKDIETEHRNIRHKINKNKHHSRTIQTNTKSALQNPHTHTYTKNQRRNALFNWWKETLRDQQQPDTCKFDCNILLSV